MKCLIILALAACAYASNFYQTGKMCPENKAAGERWNPPGTCMECYCDHNGYGCSGCETITPIFGCYETVDKTLPYPECCPRLVCPPFLPPN